MRARRLSRLAGLVLALAVTFGAAHWLGGSGGGFSTMEYDWSGPLLEYDWSSFLP
ncbi:hypothetical protein ACFQ1L_00725 [Phytohabitans flavus]|uniref:hypothetical protein n=1 Tax=Phytohabitans flavus TaxID=1076124 RepID=UPI00362DF6DB